MLIVDAQIHLWNAGNPTSPWHRQIPAYLKDDALKEMDAGGVDAAILTPHTPWDPNANELCIEAARAASRPVRDPRQLPARQAREPRAGRHVEAAPGDARLPLHLHRAGAEQVADGRHRRLAVAGGGARRPADRDDGGELPAEGRRGRPAASEPQADPRSPRSPDGGREPERAVGESAGGARAREISQRRDEGDRRAELLRSALPVSRHPRQPAAGSTTPSAPRAGSGAPTSRACPARGVSA